MSTTCGWDGGGTKTEVLCLNESGVIVAQSAFGPLNLNGSSPEQIRDTVRRAVAFMAYTPGGIPEALVIGTAGISNHAATQLLRDAVREAGYSGPLALRGDQETALSGAVEGPGAVLIAGTGAICCGRDAQGHTVRVGGYGHLIDDGGSGYAIGRDILAAVVRAEDGRDAPHCLTKAVYQQLNISSVSELITWLYRPGTSKKDVAALSPLLQHALGQQDAAALRIANRAAVELAELGMTAWRRLSLSGGEMALTGSILKHYPAIRRGVEMRLREACPDMRCIDPRGTAAYGAALLARNKEVFLHG